MFVIVGVTGEAMVICSKIYFLLPGLLFLIISTDLNAKISTRNEISKVFYHMGICEDKLVFYFKSKPVVKLISKKNNKKGITEEIYSFTDVKLSNESKEAIHKINNLTNIYCEINILQKNSDPEIKLSIKYDQKYVSRVDLFRFDAISLFNGITFNILHKNIGNNVKINLKKPNIIIDMGHGGDDCGAIGENEICEKNITYSIGIKLKNLLDKKGYNVYLTRDCDKFVALDERTTFANLLPASIFVSIHANYSKNTSACGVETYYADNSLLGKYNFDNNILIANEINKSGDEKNKILADLIHMYVLEEAHKINSGLINRKVKKSVSQVLLGAEMPAILIEIGFVSNKKECELLNTQVYQDAIAKGLSRGISAYFNN